MVTKIDAYVSQPDGRLFTDRREAIIHEARLELIKIMIDQGCNDALAKKVAERMDEISLIAEPLAREIRKELKSRGIDDPLAYYRPPIKEKLIDMDD
jgi:hypothetical protein